MAVKISELPLSSSIPNSAYIPVVANEATSKITYQTMIDSMSDELGIEELEQGLEDCFTSVSNGKRSVASAITDMGIQTGATDTFTTMASNVRRISVRRISDFIAEDTMVVDASSDHVEF